MKALPLVLLALIPTLAMANEDPRQLCAAYSSLAETALKTRYNGIPMRDMMAKISPDNPLRDQAESIIQKAYERPDYRTAERQEHEMRDFGNDVYNECFKGIRDPS